jgi:hypothetical protein|tara:strand:- start:8849 stop:9769 length:921 start_codon:yes stop_codon:yes gene_type:complete
MTTLTVLTTFPPNRWNVYAQRMVESFLQYWPKDVKLFVYYEKQKPELQDERLVYIDIEAVNPELVKFKERHKNDPVANGEITEIPGGVRRDPAAGKNDKGKGSYLWDSVRFSHKTFAVDHAIKNANTDYVLWLDADTYTFKPITREFVCGLLPIDKLVNFLGRGDKYPECGWVCYNLTHSSIKNFMKVWTDMYITDSIFNELEWHDSYLFWEVLKRTAVTDSVDIGKGAGARGHHVFINSVLGEYIDHMKGKRKIKGKSSKSDLRTERNQDYWKNVENYDPFNGIKFDPKQAEDIVGKVAKGKQGN